MRGPTRALAVTIAGLLAAPAAAAPPRPVEFPPPVLAVTVSPVPPGLERPRLDPPSPPPIPTPALDLGHAPPPRFISTVSKPLPTPADPGGFACAFVAFRRAAALTECGIARVISGDYKEAREAFEESLALDPRGAQAPAAFVWLGELALLEATTTQGAPAAARAERAYRAALPLVPPAPLALHAEVGLGLLALRRGDAPAAAAALERALKAVPPQQLALVARYLLGVARLLEDRPAEAVALWDEVVQSGAPGAILTEIEFWRGVALARLGDLNGGLNLLNRFAMTVPVNHPLRGDALVQAGWIALERRAPDEAVKRFLEAEAAGPRPELRPQIRAGLVRAYLALGDTARAAAAARQLKAESARDPLVPAALLLIADAAKARGAQGEATDIYREILLLPLPPGTQDYVRYRLAEQLELEGRLLEAKDHYRELRDKGKDEAVAQRATYRLGLVALRENDTAAARREGEGLLRAGILPELREGALLLVAESAMRGDDPNRAAAVLRTVLRDYPDSPAAARSRLALGWALLRDGDAESALREWRDVAAKADLETQALALLAVADVALRQGREAEALEALRGVTAPPPSLRNAEAVLLNRGILALRTGGDADAVQTLEPLAPRIADLGTQALARRALGVAQYHLGHYDQAERQFRLAAAAAPQEPSSWLGAGLAALAQNRLAESEDALNRARFAAGDVATSAWYGLVLVSVQRGDRDAFRERGTNFVDKFPRHPAAPAILYGLTVAALDRNDLGEAQTWTQRLLREHAASDYGTDALVRLAAAAGPRTDVARQAYRDLLARSAPADVRADASLGLAEIALAAGDAGEAQRAAEGFLRDAPAGDPRAVRANLILVRAFQAQGQPDRALATMDGFLRQYPGDAATPRLQLSRGQLLAGTQRWDAARQAFETARRADDPGVAAEAEFRLGELFRARGDNESAIEAYLSATYAYGDQPVWAAQGLQGAAQAYVARQMPREAGIVLRKLAARPGVDPALAQWARDSLSRLGPAASPSVSTPGGAAPAAKP
ncbi:MAG TPA: tetratricopeptide repeat protein [Methylomirabilota bacterium]